ncbi:hypothetical protein Tco_1183322 [Tanacetum coccineum]
MAEYSQKWHNGTSSKARSTETSDGLAAIQAHLNNLRKEIKKFNEKVYVAQRLITHSLEHPFNLQDSTEQQGQDSTNATTKILRAPDAKRSNIGRLAHALQVRRAESRKVTRRGNSNIIKEIRSSTDAVLQEKGTGGLPDLTEPNPRDHVKSISTTKADSSEIRRMGHGLYAVSREAQDVKILEAYDHTFSQKEKDPGSFT